MSNELILAASKRLSGLPSTDFIHFDGNTLPLEDLSVDFAFSFGVFHYLNHWRDMLTEALRVSSKYILFDIRLWGKDTLVDSNISYQKLALSGNWDQSSIIPYNIISMNAFLLLVRELNDSQITCKAFGYYQKPNDLAVTPAQEVLMLSVLLEKETSDVGLTLNIE